MSSRIRAWSPGTREAAMTRRIGVALALSIIGSLVFTAVALGAAQRASIELSTRAAAKAEEGYVLTARARTADGKQINQASIRFYEAVDLFGAREMFLGSAVTDGQGVGTLAYLPARLGSHAIVARYAGRDDIAPAEGRATFEGTVAADGYMAEVVPLADFSKVVTAVVGGIVLFVWALIAFALVSTARGVRQGARDLVKGDHV